MWCDLIGRWDWDWFITFTFRSDVHPEAADKRFRTWLARVEDERRKIGLCDEGLRWVRALEYQRRGVIHYHVLLGSVGELRYDVVHTHWHEGHAWVEPVRSSSAVRGYVSKYVTKGGELDIGGAGMPDVPRLRWPPRTYSRSKVRIALRAFTEDEQREVMRWLARDGRPSTRPSELLARARAAIEHYEAARRSRVASQGSLALPAQLAAARTASVRVTRPESDGGEPQVRLGEHPQALRSALTPAGAAH